jgi:hypothetical protein
MGTGGPGPPKFLIHGTIYILVPRNVSVKLLWTDADWEGVWSDVDVHSLFCKCCICVERPHRGRGSNLDGCGQGRGAVEKV